MVVPAAAAVVELEPVGTSREVIDMVEDEWSAVAESELEADWVAPALALLELAPLGVVSMAVVESVAV